MRTKKNMKMEKTPAGYPSPKKLPRPKTSGTSAKKPK